MVRKTCLAIKKSTYNEMPHQNENIIFVDTSAIIGIFNANDQNNNIAKEAYSLLKKREYKFVITNHIVAEAHALLIGRTRRPELGFTLLDTLYDSEEFSRVFINEDIEDLARSEIP